MAEKEESTAGHEEWTDAVAGFEDRDEEDSQPLLVRLIGSLVLLLLLLLSPLIFTLPVI